MPTMETLHTDLVPHAFNGMVHHPLVIASLTRDASSINRTYREKLDSVKKAEADGDWSKYVFLHERPYRLDALLSATKRGLKKKPPEFWSLVGGRVARLRKRPSKLEQVEEAVGHGD